MIRRPKWQLAVDGDEGKAAREERKQTEGRVRGRNERLE